MLDTLSVFSLLEGVVLILSLLASVVWLRQRRMRTLYDACKVQLLLLLLLLFLFMFMLLLPTFLLLTYYSYFYFYSY